MTKVLFVYSTQQLAVKLKCFFLICFFQALIVFSMGGIMKSSVPNYS